jgi:hypothetical protein
MALLLAPFLSRAQTAEVPTTVVTSPSRILDSLALERIELDIAHVAEVPTTVVTSPSRILDSLALERIEIDIAHVAEVPTTVVTSPSRILDSLSLERIELDIAHVAEVPTTVVTSPSRILDSLALERIELDIAHVVEVPTTVVTSPSRILDSLALERIEIDIAQTKERVRKTDFWHRLLPRVILSAGFAGGGDLLVLNPEERASPDILRSSFRVSITLALSDLFSDAEHQGALLDLNKLRLTSAELQIRREEFCRVGRAQRSALTEQRTILGEQLTLLDHIARFKQMQFEGGKVEYDALIRARMDLLSMRLRISTLDHQFLERNESPQFPPDR